MYLQKSEYQDLLSELISLVEKTKSNIVAYANSSVTVLFWHIGNRILTQTLENKRADYGKQIIVTLSRELTNKILIFEHTISCFGRIGALTMLEFGIIIY